MHLYQAEAPVFFLFIICNEPSQSIVTPYAHNGVFIDDPLPIHIRVFG